MSKPSDNPADPFKKALAEATKVLANDPEMTVTYSVDPAGMNREGVRLPQVSRRMTRDEVLLARGTADAFALRRKFHDEGTAAKYIPTGQLARDIYEAMETARCEAVGARAMPGTAGNIDAKIAHEADRKGYSQITQAADAPLSTAAGYLVRHLATGRAMPKGAANVMDLWRGFIEEQAGGTLENIADVLADQAALAMATSWAMTPMPPTPKMPQATRQKRMKAPKAPGMTSSRKKKARKAPSRAKKTLMTLRKRRSARTTWPRWKRAKRPRCPKANRRWSRPPQPHFPMPIPTTPSM
jgi:cobaltochelatase CobT